MSWQQAITLLTVDGEAGQCRAIVPSAPAIGIQSSLRVLGDTERRRTVPSPIVISYSHLAPVPSFQSLG